MKTKVLLDYSYVEREKNARKIFRVWYTIRV